MRHIRARWRKIRSRTRCPLKAQTQGMRLGAPLFADTSTPQAWIAALQKAGYRAAYCPLTPNADDDTVRAYAQAAQQADIVIAEVGAWSNPLSPDEDERVAAIDKCKTSLDLAERIGAHHCVNIAGSRSTQWDGPHPDNLTEETFEMIVDTTRDIIDAVKPRRTVYTLETMPWAYPDSPQMYLRLIEAIDRKGFGVHLDPVNLINSPQRYFNNAAFLRECFSLLGPYIRGVHAKDIILRPHLTVHLEEVRPGQGALNYRVLLEEMSHFSPDIPILLEHLPTEDDYNMATAFVRQVASELELVL